MILKARNKLQLFKIIKVLGLKLKYKKDNPWRSLFKI